jgi:predicted TIM-barrel fold metal-dependent hydrolase
MGSGIKNVCIHKGLFAPAVAEKFPHLLPYADVSDIGNAAKDWPQLNFIVYHSAYRWVGANPADAMTVFDKTGRSSWTCDLAEIPEKYGVTNVYGDLGQIFAWAAVAQPRLAAALMGTLVKGLGSDHIVWGTDAVWTGAPQWQIEGLRPLEIPEDMQKKYGFEPLDPADGPVKTAVFAGNSARLYGLERQHAERVGQSRPLYRNESRLPRQWRRPQQFALRLCRPAGVAGRFQASAAAGRRVGS